MKSKSTIGLVLLLMVTTVVSAKNGFDLGNSEIAPSKIYRGGPPRDGIPAIDQPRFLSVAEGEAQIQKDAWVLGVEVNGVSRAYPIAILNWHEIVNDRIGNQSFAVTYCPLCGSGVVFRVGEGDQQHHFGVSGLLYNSDVLLYDRESESLWSQLLGRAISGPRKGEKLQPLAVIHTRWEVWRRMYPETQLLSRETGFQRDYDRDPYAGYSDEAGLYFPVERLDRRYHPKERVIGVEVDGVFKGYPHSELSRANTPFVDWINGVDIQVHYDAGSGSGWITDLKGEHMVTVSAFWFAWAAFHPDTEVYRWSTSTSPK